MTETLLTKTGLEQLQRELDRLVNEWRPDIARRIKIARELGDLKENAEYHAAKDEQGLYEAKIRQLEHQIRTATVVDKVDATAVDLGTTVTARLADGDTVRYSITGSAEADPAQDRISYESPIGKALLGAQPGDVVEAMLPGRNLELTVEAIEPT